MLCSALQAEGVSGQQDAGLRHSGNIMRWRRTTPYENLSPQRKRYTLQATETNDMGNGVATKSKKEDDLFLRNVLRKDPPPVTS